MRPFKKLHIFGILTLLLLAFAIFGGAFSGPTKIRPEINDQITYEIRDAQNPALHEMDILVTNVTFVKRPLGFVTVKGVYFNLTFTSENKTAIYKAYQNVTEAQIYIWQNKTVQKFNNTSDLNKTEIPSELYPSYLPRGSYYSVSEWGWYTPPYDFPYFIPDYLMIPPNLYVNDEIAVDYLINSLPIRSRGTTIIAGTFHYAMVTSFMPSTIQLYSWIWDSSTGYLLQYKYLYVNKAGGISSVLYEMKTSNIWPFSIFWAMAYYLFLVIGNNYFWLVVLLYLLGYITISIYCKRKRKVPVIDTNNQFLIIMIFVAAFVGLMIFAQYVIVPWLQSRGIL